MIFFLNHKSCLNELVGPNDILSRFRNVKSRFFYYVVYILFKQVELRKHALKGKRNNMMNGMLNAKKEKKRIGKLNYKWC